MTPEEVFEQHLELARRIAGGYLKKLPSSIDRREVESAAMSGLWDASIRHYALPPEEFKAVASARIRGSISDEFRVQDQLPRRARASAAGRFFRLIYMDAIEDIDRAEAFSIRPDIEETIDDHSCLLRIWRVALRLPDQQREFIHRILSGERQSEIATSLGLSQARVSQIVREAVETLRRKLRAEGRLR